MTHRHPTRLAVASALHAATILSVLSVAAACGAAPLRDRAPGYDVQVLVDGIPAPTFEHRGETWVLGRKGDRYTLRIANHTGRRVEAVVSVDGRDVIDGQPADWTGKRGYLVPPWGELVIDGWRISAAEAAAFRFSTVADSYAARTGRARDVGVIGVAVFPEHDPWPRPLDLPAERSEQSRHDEYGAGVDGNVAPGTVEAEEPDRAEGAAPPAPSAGASPEAKDSARAQRRPGLGTAFGEPVRSPVREVEFVRGSSRPATVLGLRYNDRRGLEAMGIDVDGCWALDDRGLRRSADPFPRTDCGYARPPSGWPWR